MELVCFTFFFFNDTATTEIYTLSLHDALPISSPASAATTAKSATTGASIRSSSSTEPCHPTSCTDRKSTRLNSSHSQISYAVFCLKKKKKQAKCSTNKTSNITLLTSKQLAIYH